MQGRLSKWELLFSPCRNLSVLTCEREDIIASQRLSRLSSEKVYVDITILMSHWNLGCYKMFYGVGKHLYPDPYNFLVFLFLGQCYSFPECHLYNFRYCIFHLFLSFCIGGYSCLCWYFLFSFIKSIFSFMSLNTLIMTALKSLSANSNICHVTVSLY